MSLSLKHFAIIFIYALASLAILFNLDYITSEYLQEQTTSVAFEEGEITITYGCNSLLNMSRDDICSRADYEYYKEHKSKQNVLCSNLKSMETCVFNLECVWCKGSSICLPRSEAITCSSYWCGGPIVTFQYPPYSGTFNSLIFLLNAAAVVKNANAVLILPLFHARGNNVFITDQHSMLNSEFYWLPHSWVWSTQWFQESIESYVCVASRGAFPKQVSNLCIPSYGKWVCECNKTRACPISKNLIDWKHNGKTELNHSIYNMEAPWFYDHTIQDRDFLRETYGTLKANKTISRIAKTIISKLGTKYCVVHFRGEPDVAGRPNNVRNYTRIFEYRQLCNSLYPSSGKSISYYLSKNTSYRGQLLSLCFGRNSFNCLGKENLTNNESLEMHHNSFDIASMIDFEISSSCAMFFGDGLSTFSAAVVAHRTFNNKSSTMITSIKESFYRDVNRRLQLPIDTIFYVTNQPVK